jgi:hypothetical protein
VLVISEPVRGVPVSAPFLRASRLRPLIEAEARPQFLINKPGQLRHRRPCDSGDPLAPKNACCQQLPECATDASYIGGGTAFFLKRVSGPSVTVRGSFAASGIQSAMATSAPIRMNGPSGR